MVIELTGVRLSRFWLGYSGGTVAICRSKSFTNMCTKFIDDTVVDDCRET